VPSSDMFCMFMVADWLKSHNSPSSLSYRLTERYSIPLYPYLTFSSVHVWLQHRERIRADKVPHFSAGRVVVVVVQRL